MKRIWVIWLCLILTFGSSFLVININNDTQGETIVNNGIEYVPHAPIKIDSNADFSTTAFIEGWQGNGSSGNPFIIENYQIDGIFGYCIYIGNTTSHFIVRDNYLHSANRDPQSPYHSNAGVAIYNSKNGVISNNLLADSRRGINIRYSSDLIIFNNTVSSNFYFGIGIDNSYNITFMNNTVSGHDSVGIYLWYSWENILVNNTLVNDGIDFSGDQLMHWNSQIINTSNTVNGNPIYYWHDIIGGTVPGGAGQVILANCTGVTVENQIMSNGTVGITLGYSNNNFISNNTASSNDRNGIHFFCSNNNIIFNNTVFDHTNDPGIKIIESHFNKVDHNDLHNNDGEIMVSWISTNNFITNNTLSNSYSDGIWLYASDSNIIMNNDVSLTRWQGLNIYGSNNNIILNNDVTLCEDNGIKIWNSNNNLIKNNILIENEAYGIYMRNSGGNQIYHNSLYDNIQQAMDWDGGGGNYWDNGYPSGGNYWSDYTGDDLFQGPNRDQPGPDGLGDTPRLIAGDKGETDDYPLMESYLHDIWIINMTIEKSTNPAYLPIWINGSIFNRGLEDETNVEVQFLVNYIQENVTLIPSITSYYQEEVSFLWIPTAPGLYNLTLYVEPNPLGEPTYNNWRNGTVNVIGFPDIWIETTSNDFILEVRQTDSTNFTIRNDGWAELSYSINILNHFNQWKLDETAGDVVIDSVGWRNGTNMNTVINQSGRIGNSYWFDGSDAYIEIADNDSLNFDANEDFSIFSWIKTTTSNNGRFLSKRQLPGHGRGYYMRISNGKFGAYLDFGITYAFIEGTNNIADGQWHHVGIVRYDDIFEAFVDGKSIGKKYNAGGSLSNTNPLLLGVEQGLTRDYTGYIDDVCIFNWTITGNGSGLEWLSVTPGSGNLNQSKTLNHTITVDTSNLDIGFYHTCIAISSNDTTEGIIIVPVFLTVADAIVQIQMQEGWNLISLPLIQSDTAIDRVLSSIDGKWDCVQYYDATDSFWKSHNIYRPDQLNDFSTLNHKQGFWINITESGCTTLMVSGFDPTSTTIPLYAGWNLVGYPSLTNETVANALWGTGADKVEVFDPAEPYRIREVGPNYVMRPGEGYWVHVPADTTWIVDW